MCCLIEAVSSNVCHLPCVNVLPLFLFFCPDESKCAATCRCIFLKKSLPCIGHTNTVFLIFPHQECFGIFLLFLGRGAYLNIERTKNK